MVQDLWAVLIYQVFLNSGVEIVALSELREKLEKKKCKKFV